MLRKMLLETVLFSTMAVGLLVFAYGVVAPPDMGIIEFYMGE